MIVSICESREMNSMSGSKRLGYNIANLARAFSEKQGEIASVLGIAPSYLSEIVNGRKKPDRILLEKIAKHFGMSPESLMNDDFSSIKQVINLENICNNAMKLFPLFASSQSLSDIHFANAYSCQKKLYEAEEQNVFRSKAENEILFDAVVDNYTKVDEDGIIYEEYVANTVSFMFYTLIAGRAVETLVDYIYKEEEYPLILSKLLEEKPIIKKQVDSIVYGDELKDDEVFQKMINDPDLERILNESYKELKATSEKKWSDLVDYYIALQYILGAKNNAFSKEQNHDFGIDLMLKLASIDNDYAKKYIALMQIV